MKKSQLKQIIKEVIQEEIYTSKNGAEWKMSNMNYDEAVKKYGKENVRKGGKTRAGGDYIEIRASVCEVINTNEHDHFSDFEYIIKNLSDSERKNHDSLGGVVYGYLSELPKIYKEDLLAMREILEQNGISSIDARDIIVTALESMNK